MAVQIKRRDVDGVTIVDVAGKLSGDSGDSLMRQIDDLVKEGRHQLVLNLGEVSFLDSGTLGGLVSKRSEVKAAGGALKLLNVTTRLSDLLITTKLEMVFDTFESEAEAVKSWS